jgi:hypothetical protein
MDDRRGLRPRLLFKTTPGGKGAGTVGFKVRAWDPPGVRFRVKEKEPRGAFGPVCLSTQFLAGRDPAQGKCIGCSALAVAGWLTDGAFGPVCFSTQFQAGGEPAQGISIGCCVLVGWLTDGAFGPVCFSKQVQAGREPAQGNGIGCFVLEGWLTDGAFVSVCFFKTTPGGKGGDTGKRNWMLCSGWMD